MYYCRPLLSNIICFSCERQSQLVCLSLCIKSQNVSWRNLETWWTETVLALTCQLQWMQLLFPPDILKICRLVCEQSCLNWHCFCTWSQNHASSINQSPLFHSGPYHTTLAYNFVLLLTRLISQLKAYSFGFYSLVSYIYMFLTKQKNVVVDLYYKFEMQGGEGCRKFKILVWSCLLKRFGNPCPK